MKKDLEDIDKLIKEALTEEEAAFYDELEELNLLGKVGELHKGKLGWLVVLMTIVQVIAFGFFVYCLVQFLSAEETNALIKWASGGFLSIMISSFLKLFGWLQMDKRDLIREMKRLELQVSSLSAKLKQ